MSCQVGDTTLSIMSAASANSRPRSSHVPNRRQIALRAPWPDAGFAARRTSPTNASAAPNATTRTATAPIRKLAVRAKGMNSSSISSLPDRRPDNAPKAEVTCRGVDRFRKPGGRAIASAVVRRAQMRSAFDHLARNLDRRLARVVAVFGPRASWIVGNAAGLEDLRRMLWLIPVRGPFPDIADHVVEPIAVRWKRSDRRGACIAVPRHALPRKLPLPGVGHMAIAWQELVSPGI